MLKELSNGETVNFRRLLYPIVHLKNLLVECFVSDDLLEQLVHIRYAVLIGNEYALLQALQNLLVQGVVKFILVG